MDDLALVILTVVTPLVYVTVVAFNLLGGVGRDLGIFKSSVGDQSNKYYVGITPAGWMFSIWSVIYIWEAIWIVYTLVNLCRKVGNGKAYNSPILLPVSFFAVFIVNLLLNLSWLFLFDRDEIETAFVALFLIALSLYICLFESYRYLDRSKDELIKMGRTTDVWLVRILVQNGLSVYATWTSIATLLNMAIVMIHSSDPGVSNAVACTVALSVLLAELLAYFIADIVFLDRYLRYTVTPYVVVPLALGASISKNWEDGARNSIFTAALLGISLACLIVKVVMLIWRHLRSPSNSASITDSTENIKKDDPRTII